MITRGETKVSSRFMMPPGITNPPQKSSTMMGNQLGIRGQKSELLNSPVGGKPKQRSGKNGYIVVAEDFGSDQITSGLKESNRNSVVSPKPTEQLQTEVDVGVSNDQKNFANMLGSKSVVSLGEASPLTVEPSPGPKKVKDGVDILALDASKGLSECESSLELILVTLSQSFSMSPKQAAALLTNNN